MEVQWSSKLYPDPRNQYSFKESWLSDPSTYPLLTALVFGGTLILGFSVNALTNYRGVKISSDIKHADMPLESAGQVKATKHLAESIVSKTGRPTSFHSRKYSTLGQEGLGIDHEAWKAAKQAANKRA